MRPFFHTHSDWMVRIIVGKSNGIEWNRMESYGIVWNRMAIEWIRMELCKKLHSFLNGVFVSKQFVVEVMFVT